MGVEANMVAGITADPHARDRRTVYADWLEAQGDPRAAFVRADMAMWALEPDDLRWARAEGELSDLRVGCAPEWLAQIETRPVPAPTAEGPCECLASAQSGRRSTVLHRERQDTRCDGWQRLLDLIEDAAADGRAELVLGRELGEHRSQIVTLPATIAKLEALESLVLWGTSLARVPIELASLPALRDLDTYMVYSLHWYPYELTRLAKLNKSALSTRTVYGNLTNRMVFPTLSPRLEVDPRWGPATRPCSVCEAPFDDRGLHRVWVSINVGTDVRALLVNACSAACVAALPPGAPNHVATPHRGGVDLAQGAGY